jgi:hypothetical protein
MLFRLLQQRFVLFFQAIARADKNRCFAWVDDGLPVGAAEAVAYAIDGCIRSRLTPLAGRKWPPR